MLLRNLGLIRWLRGSDIQRAVKGQSEQAEKTWKERNGFWIEVQSRLKRETEETTNAGERKCGEMVTLAFPAQYDD
jgi:hypothetical protein